EPDATPTKDQQTTDNCNADQVVATGQVNTAFALWQGNQNLKPEKSVNLTYGLVYSSHFIPDLNLKLDFYKITVDKYITIGDPLGQYFLDSCYKQSKRNYCEKVHRDNGGQGEVTYVDVPFFNLGSISTAGVDFDVDYIL